MNEKKSNALHKRFPARFLLLALAACLAMAFIPFAAAQGEGEGQMQYFQFAYYFNYGSSNGECYANCYGPCLASCTATAASAGTTWNNCGSVCPSSCSSHCASYFASVPQANDGLPIPQTPEGWNPYESAGTPQEYWPRTPPNLPYSPPSAPATPPQSGWTAEPTEPQQPENYLTPCYPGQNYCVSPGTESQTEGEPAIPTFPPCTPENYCYYYRTESVGVGTPEPEPVCPDTAPDGHPMRWYDYLGCQDIYWKEHYCAVGTSCNGCFGRQGCIWNGAACVPCNAPSCSYFCPRAGGAAPGGANGQQAQAPAAPEPIIVRQKEMPAPTPQLPSEVATPVPGQPTAQPPAGVSPQPAAVTAIPTPPLQCGSYASCKSCAKAPRAANGESQCGWSAFFDACINGDAWGSLNASGFKVGWIDEEKSCSNGTALSYCFEFKDCFSCAGAAGIRRLCQWSEKESKCVPYSPLGDFKTKDNPGANDVIIPSQCKEHDCGKYADCRQCEENAACAWNYDDKKCSDFKGQAKGTPLKSFSGNCPAPSASATPSPSPTPLPCPKDCECSSQARVLKCGGTTVNDTGFVHSDRAAANAAAATSMEHVDEIGFNQPTTGNAVFTVKGSRSGALFFLIPVSMDVTATVNAQTGAVEKIDAPWWAFLAG